MLTVFSLSAKLGSLANVPQQKQLSFIHNAGQVTDQHRNKRNDIDYKISLTGMAIFIGDAQLHYHWYKHVDSTSTSAYRMDVTLVGANVQAPVIATEQQGFYERYFNGNTGNDGLVAHTYNRITYTNVYPNIDWVLYTKGDALKYDFIVHPGGNPANIKLRYDGATALAMNNGALSATTPYGSITEKAPYSYNAETKQTVRSAYKLNGNVLSFDVDKTDGTLVIDPQLLWGTYYGGEKADRAYNVTSDKIGNIYVCGYTLSQQNIATVGAYQSVSVTTDRLGYLLKLDANGKQQWGTYYGNGNNELVSLAIDKQGYVYAGGNAVNSGLASLNAHQVAPGGMQDGILVKFSPGGSRLWATYYGGNDRDNIRTINCDKDDNVYIAGETRSAGGIATAGTHRSQYSTTLFGDDGYLAKFDGSGNLQWGTYFGGSGTEQVAGICADSMDGLYFAGISESAGGLATPNAFQTTVNTGYAHHGYFGKLNTVDGTLTYSSYFSGNSVAGVYTICCTPNGNFYIGGTTNSISGIATQGSHSSVMPANATFEGYVSKFNKDGAQVWGSYLGNDSFAEVVKIDCNLDGYLFAAGRTTAKNGIATPGAHQSVCAGKTDGFVTGWTAEGNMIWGTYYGGAQDESLIGCAYNVAGEVTIAGTTQSSTGIATAGAHQSALGDVSGDVFIAAISTEIIINIHQSNGDVLYCIGDTFNLNYVVNQDLPAGNVFTAQLSDANRSFANPVAIGTLQSSTAGKIFCTIPLNTPPGTRYRLRIVSSTPVIESADNIVDLRVRNTLDGITATATTPLCAFDTLRLDAKLDMEVPAIYKWTGPNGYTANTQKAFYNGVSSLYNGKYVVTATEGYCSSADTVEVIVRDKVQPLYVKLQADKAVREDTTITFTASVANAIAPQYRWQLNGADIVGETKQTLTISNLKRGDKINVIVTVAPLPCLDANTALSDTLIVAPPGTRKLLLYPNPNNGVFTILGSVQQGDGPLHMDIVNAMGVVLWTDTATVADKLIRKTIDITPLNLAPGAYILRLHAKGEVQDSYRHFSIVK